MIDRDRWLYIELWNSFVTLRLFSYRFDDIMSYFQSFAIKIALYSPDVEERCLSLFLFISLHRWKISSRMKIHADTENWRDAEIWKILNFKLELYRNFEFFSNFEKRTCNIVNKNCCKSYIFIHENTCI